jgi:hypothetical protein
MPHVDAQRCPIAAARVGVDLGNLADLLRAHVASGIPAKSCTENLGQKVIRNGR